MAWTIPTPTRDYLWFSFVSIVGRFLFDDIPHWCILFSNIFFFYMHCFALLYVGAQKSVTSIYCNVIMVLPTQDYHIIRTFSIIAREREKKMRYRLHKWIGQICDILLIQLKTFYSVKPFPIHFPISFLSSFFLHRKSINVNWFLFFFFLSLLFHYTSINTDRIDEMLQRFPIEYCLVCVICFFFPCFGVYDVSNIVSITSVAFHFKTQKPLSPSPTVFFSSSLVSHFLWAMEWPLF